MKTSKKLHFIEGLRRLSRQVKGLYAMDRGR